MYPVFKKESYFSRKSFYVDVKDLGLCLILCIFQLEVRSLNQFRNAFDYK